MKRVIIFAITLAMFFTACTKTGSIEPQANKPLNDLAGKNVNQISMESIVFTNTNLFPEGVVFDKFNNKFYVSSTTRGTIGIVDGKGNYSQFITDAALTGTTGLEIDESRKLLFACNSSAGSVGVYNINNGKQVAFIDLKTLLPGTPVFINDIAIDPKGNAYVTNSFAPVLYTIDKNFKASIFYQDAAFANPGFGFNGIEYGKQNGGFLLVAFSSKNQIVKLPVNNPAQYNVVQLNAPLAGPDGLLLSTNGKELDVVSNAGGGNGRVTTFTSIDKWQSGNVFNIFETGSVFPTTATTDGKSVFVLYAYLNRRATGQADYTIQQVR